MAKCRKSRSRVNEFDSEDAPFSHIERKWDEIRKRNEIEHERRMTEAAAAVANLSPRERADLWMRQRADKMEWEAIVYRTSRGECHAEQVQRIADSWRIAEEQQIAEAIAADKVRSVSRGIVEKLNKRFEDISVLDMGDFWGTYPIWIDALVFRLAKTCRISGFDRWFRRYAKNLKNGIVQFGVAPEECYMRLFQLCRSDLAVELLREPLSSVMDVIAFSAFESGVSFGDSFPMDPPHAPSRHNLMWASSALFCAHRLGLHEKHPELCNVAMDILIRHQAADGGWTTLSGFPGSLSSHEFTTCMAMHSLAMARPLGFESTLKKSKEWLWSLQNGVGYWGETYPDQVELSVLILDSIDLADGKTAISFDLASSTPKTDRRKTNPKKRGRRVSRDQEADKRIHDGFVKRKHEFPKLRYEEYGKGLTPPMTRKQVQAAIESHKKKLFPHRKK